MYKNNSCDNHSIILTFCVVAATELNGLWRFLGLGGTGGFLVEPKASIN